MNESYTSLQEFSEYLNTIDPDSDEMRSVLLELEQLLIKDIEKGHTQFIPALDNLRKKIIAKGWRTN